jgi:hypothetical protein
MGHPYAGWRIILLVAGLDLRAIGLGGSPLRHVNLDPSADYLPMPSARWSPSFLVARQVKHSPP